MPGRLLTAGVTATVKSASVSVPRNGSGRPARNTASWLSSRPQTMALSSLIPAGVPVADGAMS
jgi:hypothetical protein